MSGLDERGIQQLLEQLAHEIEKADLHFRGTHAGLPFEVVRADAVDALPSNIQLAPEQLDAYAAAVAAGEPFEFRLGG